MAYLIKTTEVYRVETEEQAKNFIEEQKQNDAYEVVKYSSERKDRKVKGEIAEEWMRVTIIKQFDSEKEPCGSIKVTYE